MRDSVADDVQELVVALCWLEESSYKKICKVVQVRVVCFRVWIADHMDRILVDCTGSLCPWTPHLLTILVVEVATANHGKAHLA